MYTNKQVRNARYCIKQKRQENELNYIEKIAEVKKELLLKYHKNKVSLFKNIEQTVHL